MKNVNIILPLIFITFLLGCEKSTDWEQQGELTPQLIVEAILTDENIPQEIRLSQSFRNLNDSIPFVTNAIVTVEANGVIYNFTPDTDDLGKYVSVLPFQVINNLEYILNIEWEGETYSASSNLSSVAPMPNISFVPYNDTDSLELNNFAPIFDFNQQALYEIFVDWSFLTNEIPNQAQLYFYTFSDVHISEFIPPPKEDIFFPKGSIIIAKKFGLNDDFANYLKSKVIETDWNGTVFYAAAQNLPTNISNNGLGFFSTCSVLSDTLIAQ